LPFQCKIRGGKARRNLQLLHELKLHTSMKIYGRNRFVQGHDLHFSIHHSKKIHYQIPNDNDWYYVHGKCSFTIKAVVVDGVPDSDKTDEE
ncbi:unnamed protein product, partial [Didymodactylos carnosus]